MSSLERALVIAVQWLVPSVVLVVPLLAVPASADRLWVSTTHLIAVVSLSWLLADRLLPLTDTVWFGAIVSDFWRRFGVAASIAALVTGYAALLTLASSAALRLDPSLQFLQLLSALDIAWVVTATMIGVRWLRGQTAGRLAGAAMSVICVWSIWRYLDEVGFSETGGWLVDSEALGRLVLPYDIAAAIIAIGVVMIAIRRLQREGVGPTEQPTPQS